MLYGVGVVKDDADVLEQSIRHAVTFCDRVFYIDNDSSDDSWAIIEALASEMPAKVVAYERIAQPFVEGLRSRIVNEVSDDLGAGTWWLKLDADEFLDSDPRPSIRAAERKGADGILAWSAQFALTDLDVRDWEAGRDDRSRPISQRRRHFLVDWREVRLWRNQPGIPWVDESREFPPWVTKLTTTGLFNRHYPYRDPVQAQQRIELRRGNPAFSHVDFEDWRSVVRPASKYHLYNEGSPFRVDWPQFVRNKVRVKARQAVSHLRSSTIDEQPL